MIDFAGELHNFDRSRPQRNLELKARCWDLQQASELVARIGSTRTGELLQIDTYFRAPQGRLKLRETQGRPAELIAYERANETAVRGSDYYVITIAQPDELKAALSRMLGVRGEVHKRRELWMYHNVRVHLDNVAGLGSFIEFEAVLSPGEDEATSLRRLATLTEALAVRDEDRIAVGYADLAGL
jgi:adenylate cyclase, class 2